MLRLISFLLFLSVFSLSKNTAQAPGKPMAFGLVNQADLDMVAYPADSTAPAVVLCEYGDSRVKVYSDGAKLESNFHRRIKILDRSGFDYGDVSIPFYSFKKQEKFFLLGAMIHLPNGEKMEVGKKDIFIEERSKYWSRAKFTFPKLEVGCIIEYHYSIHSESIYDLVDWFFQEEIPVRYSELRIDFPDRFAYSYLFQGNEGMAKIKEDEQGNEVFSGENGTFTMGKRRFVMENAPAMKPEAFVTTMDDYRARIRFQLAEYMLADGRIEKVMTNWENAKADLDHHAYFGEQYRKKSHYKKITEQVTAQVKALPEKERAYFLYDYILGKMTWNGYFSLSSRAEKLSDIFPKGEGSSAEINLMLLACLREAGIEAYPLITSTRSNGKMYEDYPLIDQFNHTLVYALVNGNPLLMDALDPLRPPGYPSVDALNGRGVLIRDKGAPEWVDIKAPRNGADIFKFDLELDGTGNVSGQFSGAYKGYNAAPERRAHHRSPGGKHWEERLSEHYSGLDIQGANTGELENVDTTFFDTLQFQIEGAAQVAGDFIYVSPVLYSAFLENPLKLTERNYPVDFPYPFAEQYIMSLKIPDGYRVEELPGSARFSLPGNGGLFHFFTEEKTPGIIQVNTRFLIRQLKFYPHQYEGIKELFDLVAEKCGEQIVLVREP